MNKKIKVLISTTLFLLTPIIIFSCWEGCNIDDIKLYPFLISIFFENEIILTLLFPPFNALFLILKFAIIYIVLSKILEINFNNYKKFISLILFIVLLVIFPKILFHLSDNGKDEYIFKKAHLDYSKSDLVSYLKKKNYKYLEQDYLNHILDGNAICCRGAIDVGSLSFCFNGETMLYRERDMRSTWVNSPEWKKGLERIKDLPKCEDITSSTCVVTGINSFCPNTHKIIKNSY